MKRIISLVLAFALLLVGCGSTQHEQTTSAVEEQTTESIDAEQGDDGLGDIEIDFTSLSDEDLLQYVEDSVYSELGAQLNSEDYIIQDVSAVYISKEYLDELAYNSQSNIYFGYTLEEVEAQFDGDKFVFTCNDEGETVVTKYEEYDDTYEQVIKNVAIGTGVILVCVTVSVVSGGAGAPAVSAIFAASAKTGTTFALSTGLISGATSALVTGFQTGDVKQTVDAAALSASEGFKWGAITGVITGGASKALEIHKAARTASSIPTPRESEIYAKGIYGGDEQVSYLAGEKVAANTPGATRPDVVVTKANGSIEAIEVKNYNLASQQSRNTLYSELERQVTSRVENLPAGSTQKIVLDTRGRGFSKELTSEVVKTIQSRLSGVYPNIPIEVL